MQVKNSRIDVFFVLIALKTILIYRIDCRGMEQERATVTYLIFAAGNPAKFVGWSKTTVMVSPGLYLASDHHQIRGLQLSLRLGWK